MGYAVYYVEAGDTLPHLFGSYDGGTGASITLTGLAVTDIEIYKDGGVTTRASDSGYALLGTDGIDEFGTGIHGFSINLSDNSDAGFYAVGSWYHVVIASVTVDAQVVNFVACAFRIVSATRGLAGTALPDAAADAAGGLPVSDAGGLDLDAQILTDIDAILVDTGTTLQAEVDGIQADTEDIQSRIPAALVGGRMDSDIGAKTGNVALSAQEKLDVNAEVDTALNTAIPGAPTADSVNERVVNIDDNLPTVAGVADQVWDETLTDHESDGSTGRKLAARRIDLT